MLPPLTLGRQGGTVERSALLVTGIKIGENSFFFKKLPQNSSKTLRKDFQAFYKPKETKWNEIEVNGMRWDKDGLGMQYRVTYLIYLFYIFLPYLPR